MDANTAWSTRSKVALCFWRSCVTTIETVGIEVQCAQHLRVRWRILRFPAGPHSGSRLVHVSASPPTIPDGGISPVRF